MATSITTMVLIKINSCLKEHLKNIASFITHNAMHKSTITDLGDNLIVTSAPGGFVDECPNNQ